MVHTPNCDATMLLKVQEIVHISFTSFTSNMAVQVRLEVAPGNSPRCWELLGPCEDCASWRENTCHMGPRFLPDNTECRATAARSNFFQEKLQIPIFMRMAIDFLSIIIIQ